MSLFKSAVAVDGSCLTLPIPWSVIDVSASMTGLAGLLAGFMISALTTLLAMKRDSTALFLFGVKHATVLLAVGIIILGLDAYLFGSTAATRPAQIDGAWPEAHSVCQRAWIGFMPATGLLTMGAVVLVAGLSWIVVCHGEPKEVHWLATFSNYAMTLVAVGSLALLTYGAGAFTATMHDYNKAPEGWRYPTQALIVIYFLINFGYYIYKMVAVNIFLPRKSRTKSSDTTTPNPPPTAVEYDPDDCVRAKVGQAAIAVTAYLTVAMAFTLFTALRPRDDGAVEWDYIGYWGGVFLCALAPGIIFWLVVRATPGMNEEHALTPVHSSRATADENG
ncbi:hypothetical protein [Mycolicibacterium sp.]|uniref:hypothetical protein n=1 Tax=Mycolicibacterium sp. TaxID=2320850 RepID=UPI0037CBD9B1